MCLRACRWLGKCTLHVCLLIVRCQPQVFLLRYCPPCFETDFLTITWVLLIRLDWEAIKPQGPSSLCLLVLWYQVHTIMPGFLCGHWELNSCHHEVWQALYYLSILQYPDPLVAGFHYAALAGLKLTMIFLSPILEFWDYRNTTSTIQWDMGLQAHTTRTIQWESISKTIERDLQNTLLWYHAYFE